MEKKPTKVNDSQPSIEIERSDIFESTRKSQQKSAHNEICANDNKKIILFIVFSFIFLIIILRLTHVVFVYLQTQPQNNSITNTIIPKIITSHNQLLKSQDDAINDKQKEEQKQNQIYSKKQLSTNFKIAKKNIPQKQDKNDLYEFALSVQQLVKKNLQYPINIKSFSNAEISKSQFQRAIRLLQVVHNVNFKGQFVLDHYDFYPSPEAKVETLFKLLQEQKKYFNEKYEINKYARDQIGICVYVPSYNNVKKRLYLRNLDSIFQQEYQNYHIVFVNDASTDGTGDYVKKYMEENEIPSEKYTIINNEKNKGNCANIYNAGHNHCKEGEIMILLDGDDSLIGRQVFSLLNAIYQKQKVALTYGEFLFIRQNQIQYGKASRVIPQSNLAEGTVRKLKRFFTSHLKTMYVDVFRQIKLSDFQYENGTFYEVASDVAFMASAVQLVGTRLKFLHEFIYEYRFDTGQNDGKQKQINVGPSIYSKTPNKKMEKMQFADNPKTIHYEQI